jgi:hypothetical protein
MEESLEEARGKAGKLERMLQQLFWIDDGSWDLVEVDEMERNGWPSHVFGSLGQEDLVMDWIDLIKR